MTTSDRVNQRCLAALLLALGGAVIGIFTAGTKEPWGFSAFFLGAGLAGLVATPSAKPKRVPTILGLLFVAATLLAQLPLSWFGTPAWRMNFPTTSLVQLGNSVAVMPGLAIWWSGVLLLTWMAARLLLSTPLEMRSLATFLHIVSGVIAVYAVTSIVDQQTTWNYPFSQGGVFGLLPNRNHTATVLVVGAIISFGLMQWELLHGWRIAAASAALCGAPALAALLFFSVSRAGVLLLCAGFLIWAAGAARTAANRRMLAVSAAALVIFLGGLFVFGGSTVRNRIGSLLKDSLAAEPQAQQAEPVDFRLPIFKDAISLSADAPITGIGLGHFADEFPHYQKAALRSAWALHPESDWMMVVAESGVLAVVALGLLAAWYLKVMWAGRSLEGGLLRWTVASAIAAAMLHALIDVPWHRAPLGWFLLVTACAAIPRGQELVWPKWLRVEQICLGVLLLVAGGCLGWMSIAGRPLPHLRWEDYDTRLKLLGEEQKHEKGVYVAQDAIAEFPLNPRAYLWYMGFARTFIGMESEMAEAGRLASYVDPVQPRIPSGEAVVWAGIDSAAEASARAEAAQRAARIDRKEMRPDLSTAGWQIYTALEAAKTRPEVQRLLLAKVSNEPILVAYWMRSADAVAAAAWARDVADPAAFLEALPEDLRDAVLRRWVTLPDAAGAVQFMEAREAAEGKPTYWRQLSRYYAAQRDLPRAVQTVASALDALPLPTAEGDSDLQGEMAALAAQGNTVAARRLAADALAARKADVSSLRAAMTYFAAQEDWESAWKAASRLANEAKVGQ